MVDQPAPTRRPLKVLALFVMALGLQGISFMVFEGPASGPAIEARLPDPCAGTPVIFWTNTNASGAGSLRDAVAQANMTPGRQTISGTLSPGSVSLTSTLVISDTNGTCLLAPVDAGGNPTIILDGSVLASGSDILVYRGGAGRVAGLILMNSPRDGGVWENARDIEIINSSSERNSLTGWRFDDIVGGLLDGLSSSNNNSGFQIANSSEVIIQNSSWMTNTTFGAFIQQSVGVTITNNTASDNMFALELSGVDQAMIEDNIITGNGSGPGGSTANDVTLRFNTIANNPNSGVFANGDNWLVHDNIFDNNGSAHLTLFLSANSTIGPGNSFWNGPANAVDLTGSSTFSTKISDNLFGTDGAGTSLGNSGIAVFLTNGAHDNIIGPNNVVTLNGGAVVLSPSAGNGNTIRNNSIFDNSGLAIDLNDDGVTPNDPGDGDTGPNGLQNFPDLVAALTNTGDVIGTLMALPNTPYDLDLYVSPTCDFSGFGEMKDFAGSANVSSDATGLATLSMAVTSTINAGDYLVPVATGPEGTSEAGECHRAAPADQYATINVNASQTGIIFDDLGLLIQYPVIGSNSDGTLFVTLHKLRPENNVFANTAQSQDGTPFGGGNIDIFGAHYWDVEARDQSGFQATICILLDNYPGLLDANKVVLGQRPEGSNTWVLFNTSVLNSGGTDFACIDGVGSYSEFGLFSNSAFNRLPVELIAFDAAVDGATVLLTWRTASETNNAGFFIEHQAGGAGQDGSWQQRAFVEGRGTTNAPQTYTYRLADLPPGHHQFRLKQIDFDGAFFYSDEVESTLEMAERFVLEPPFPNPFNPQATVRFAVREAQPVRVALYDALGRHVRLLYQGVPPAGQTQQLQIDGAALPSGLYLVRLSGFGFTRVERILLIK